MSMDNGLLFSLAAGVLAVLYAVFSVRWVLSRPTGNERMRTIALAIQEGARAYLNRQHFRLYRSSPTLRVRMGPSSARGWTGGPPRSSFRRSAADARAPKPAARSRR